MAPTPEQAITVLHTYFGDQVQRTSTSIQDETMKGATRRTEIILGVLETA